MSGEHEKPKDEHGKPAEGHGDAHAKGAEQIGRASCRERVSDTV